MWKSIFQRDPSIVDVMGVIFPLFVQQRNDQQKIFPYVIRTEWIFGFWNFIENVSEYWAWKIYQLKRRLELFIFYFYPSWETRIINDENLFLIIIFSDVFELWLNGYRLISIVTVRLPLECCNLNLYSCFFDLRLFSRKLWNILIGN